MENVIKGVKNVLSIVQEMQSLGLRQSFYKLVAFNYARRGTFVGEDEAGNKYYENKESQFLRDRWVEVKYPLMYDKVPYSGDLYTQVPPEWAHWLSRQSDNIPTNPNTKYLRPFFLKPHRPNPTGTEDCYLPSGHILRDGLKGDWQERNWAQAAVPSNPITNSLFNPGRPSTYIIPKSLKEETTATTNPQLKQ